MCNFDSGAGQNPCWRYHKTRATRSSGKTGPFSCNSVLCHPMLAEPSDHEEDCSKNDRKKYEQAYYISHPTRRQGIIDVCMICFLFVSFHLVTPFATCNLFLPPSRSVCQKTPERVNRESGAKRKPQNFRQKTICHINVGPLAH